MCELAIPVTEWGNGEADSARRRRKRSPPGIFFKLKLSLDYTE